MFAVLDALLAAGQTSIRDKKSSTFFLALRPVGEHPLNFPVHGLPLLQPRHWQSSQPNKSAWSFNVSVMHAYHTWQAEKTRCPWQQRKTKSQQKRREAAEFLRRCVQTVLTVLPLSFAERMELTWALLTPDGWEQLLNTESRNNILDNRLPGLRWGPKHEGDRSIYVHTVCVCVYYRYIFSFIPNKGSKGGLKTCNLFFFSSTS